jgi:DNA-binding transcriptional regulator YhcF (GntR family)
MSNDFKIQIPQYIVRSNEINEKDFVLLAKLIQIYKMQSGEDKSLTFSIVSYKKLMNYIDMTDQRTFLRSLNNLYDNGLITEQVKRLPRNGQLTISLSKKVIPDLNPEQLFTQLESWVISMEVIEKVKHTGVRILYYIMSWINYSTNKDHCYASVERMAKDIGVSEKTFSKYIAILEKAKFIKVVRHDVTVEHKDNKYGVENLLLDRWNNHYYINHDKIKKHVEKGISLVG